MAPVLINEEPYTSIWSYPDFAMGPAGVLKMVEGQLVLLPLQCSDATAAGGRVPDAATCQGCHRRSAQFPYAEKWAAIAH